jgi:hypothetical protein
MPAGLALTLDATRAIAILDVVLLLGSVGGAGLQRIMARAIGLLVILIPIVRENLLPSDVVVLAAVKAFYFPFSVILDYME